MVRYPESSVCTSLTVRKDLFFHYDNYLFIILGEVQGGMTETIKC